MSGPPPPSAAPIDPAWAAESNLGRILGVTTAIHVVAFVTVSLRLYVRIKMIKSPGRDDWTMVAATVCAFGGWLCFVLQGLHGLGRHQRIIDPLDLIQMNHVGFWQSIISATGAMALLKVSIALNLLRLSPSRWYTWSLWSSIVFVCAYSFMGWMTFFLHCKPMEAHWDTRIKSAKCYSIELFVIFALINTSFNIFTDVLFASFPIPVIWKLQMKRKVRIYLIGILSLGYVAVAMGILKAVYQIAFAKDMDKSFNSWVTFWGFLQLNIGIIAACAPSLKPLVSRALKLSEYNPYAYPSGRGYGRSGYGNGSRSRSRGAARTLASGVAVSSGGGKSALSSKLGRTHPGGCSSDEELEMEMGVGMGRSTASATATGQFYKGGGGKGIGSGDSGGGIGGVGVAYGGERSGSEELILQGRNGDFSGGIVRTTEVIVQ